VEVIMKSLPQPVPQVSREEVVRGLKREFPGESIEVLMTELDEYGIPGNPGRERVQLDVLKLARGNREKFREMIQEAKEDVREVIAAAEYREYMKLSPTDALVIEAANRAVEADWREYQEWLQRK